MGYLPEFIFHDKLLVASIASKDKRLVSFSEINAKLVQFILEVVLGRNGKINFASVLLGHLQNSVAPVVCSFGIFDVINSVIGNYKGIAEVLPVVSLAMAYQTMAEKNR